MGEIIRECSACSEKLLPTSTLGQRRGPFIYPKPGTEAIRESLLEIGGL